MAALLNKQAFSAAASSARPQRKAVVVRAQVG